MSWSTIGGFIASGAFFLVVIWIRSDEPLLDDDSRIRAWCQRRAAWFGRRLHRPDDGSD